MKGVGSQTKRSLGTLAAPSQRFSASRRMSLLRAAGVNALDESHPASPTGSQASTTPSDVAPVGTLVETAIGDYPLHTEGGVDDCGDAPKMFAAGAAEAETKRPAAAVVRAQHPVVC